MYHLINQLQKGMTKIFVLIKIYVKKKERDRHLPWLLSVDITGVHRRQ
jgi:hypothetical protein